MPKTLLAPRPAGRNATGHLLAPLGRRAALLLVALLLTLTNPSPAPTQA